MSYELKETADGSHTLFVREMDEHYHSVNGAIQEALHVYLQAGYRCVTHPDIRLLEIGFGTGLNALLTWREAEERQIPTVYYTMERYPLSVELVHQLNYGSLVFPEEPERLFRLHEAAWGETIPLSPFFSLHKLHTDSNTSSLPIDINVVYFDAFGPDKQPEMWNQSIFDKLYTAMRFNGVLTTYCAKGAVRRMMKQAGFLVERIPGPPGKREMLRARKAE